MRPRRKAALLLAVALIASTGCASAEELAPTSQFPPPPGPEARAAQLATTGCGFAPDRTGSGVAVGNGLVLTVAHVVARADAIAVTIGSGEETSAEVVAIDLDRDLALLRVPSAEPPPVTTAAAAVGTTGRIVAGAASGTVPFEVETVVRLSIERVLGTERSSRNGYELTAETARGDSGAGAYDATNRLIGIVFATSSEEESTWVTASAEIEDFIASADPQAEPLSCDAARSRLDLS